MEEKTSNKLNEDDFWLWLKGFMPSKEFSEMRHYAHELNSYFKPKYGFSISIFYEMVRTSPTHVRNKINRDKYYQKKYKPYDKKIISLIFRYMENYIFINRPKTNNEKRVQSVIIDPEKQKAKITEDVVRNEFLNYMEYSARWRKDSLLAILRNSEQQIGWKNVFSLDMDKNLKTVLQLRKDRKDNITRDEYELFNLLDQFFTGQKQNPVWHVDTKDEEKKIRSEQLKQSATSILSGQKIIDPVKLVSIEDDSQNPISEAQTMENEKLLDGRLEKNDSVYFFSADSENKIEISKMQKEIPVVQTRSEKFSAPLPQTAEQDLIESVRTLLEELSRKKSYGVSAAIIAGKINSDKHKVFQILMDADWAKETFDGFIYSPEEHKVQKDTIQSESIQDTADGNSTDISDNKELLANDSDNINGIIYPTTELFRKYFANQGMSEYTESYIDTFCTLEKILRNDSHNDQLRLLDCEPQIIHEAIDFFQKNRYGVSWNTDRNRDAINKLVCFLNELESGHFKTTASVNHSSQVSENNITQPNSNDTVYTSDVTDHAESTASTSDPDSPSAQPRWTLHEAAVLLNAYLKVQREPEKRKFYVQQVSNQLRQMAIDQGMQISDTYRNINGICFQMSAMETAWTGRDPVGHAHSNVVFDKIVRVYRDDRSKFHKILEEAQKIQPNNGFHNNITNEKEKILCIISNDFPHGIRPSSVIDINRLKRIYFDKYKEEISSEINLEKFLFSYGIRNGDKVYILSEEQKKSIKDLINGIFEKGYNVVYYSELLSNHTNIMEACHLFDTSLMCNIFKNIFPNIVCKQENLIKNKESNEIEEITCAFGDSLVLNYQQVKQRCPYLTMDVIRWALSKSDRFVWSSAETFAQTDLILLDQSEVLFVEEKIIPQLSLDGYFSLAKLPLEESCSLNPDVSVSAVRDAMYIRHMKGLSDRHGLIISPKGITISSTQLIEAWCKEHDTFTLRDLEEYERELTGHHPNLGITIACNSMIRIDHDNFVSDTLININIDKTDIAIGLFVGNRVIPISAITSFTSFPDVSGYAWNLYLVESFLRRFSRRFNIDGGPAQRSFVGGICSNDLTFDTYEDRLAYAVIQDGISLSDSEIGKYLTDNKYILRRSDIVQKVLEKAQFLAEL